MQTYCTEITRRTHLPVIFEAEDGLPEFPDAYNITLYRTLQEALTNVIKHAHASQVWVELSMDDDQVTLTIQDNGIGFGSEQSGSNGIGLAGLRERPKFMLVVALAVRFECSDSDATLCPGEVAWSADDGRTVLVHLPQLSRTRLDPWLSPPMKARESEDRAFM